MANLVPYTEVMLVPDVEIDIINADGPAVYWPEIDLPVSAPLTTEVTIKTYRKRPGNTEVPVGDTLTIVYPMMGTDQRTYEAAGIRSDDGIRITIESSHAITVHRKLDGDTL